MVAAEGSIEADFDGCRYFFRCRMRDRIRRFLRPIFRRPLPVFLTPTDHLLVLAVASGVVIPTPTFALSCVARLPNDPPGPRSPRADQLLFLFRDDFFLQGCGQFTVAQKLHGENALSLGHAPQVCSITECFC